MKFEGLIMDMMFRGATMDEILDAVKCCEDVINVTKSIERLEMYREKYKPYPAEKEISNEY